MLVLSRKQHESIVIDATVTITVLRVKGNKVQIGIDAPSDVHVVRGELPRRGAVRHDHTVGPPECEVTPTPTPTGATTPRGEQRQACTRPLRHFLQNASRAGGAATGQAGSVHLAPVQTTACAQ